MLAVVVLGLYLNYYSSCVSVEVHGAQHAFYEMVAYILNTVIFFIAGVILGSNFFRAVITTDDGISKERDFPRAIAVYVGCLAVRALVLALFFPLLRRLGTGLDLRSAVVVAWGGLRGAVGLALALVIHHSAYDHGTWGGATSEQRDEEGGGEQLLCRDVPSLILFHTCCIVLFTVPAEHLPHMGMASS